MAAITGGVWPAVFSALNDDGEPNLEAMDQLVELFNEQQLDGLYLLGSTGQGPALSVASRKKIAERVVKTNAGRLPVIVHVGAVSTDDAIALARHAAAGKLVDGAPDLSGAEQQLCALRGIGPWTASYIAMRALREPDAFPAGDLGLRRTVSAGADLVSPRVLERMAERWRPWRAYAAMHLWVGDVSRERASQRPVEHEDGALLRSS